MQVKPRRRRTVSELRSYAVPVYRLRLICPVVAYLCLPMPLLLLFCKLRWRAMDAGTLCDFGAGPNRQERY
jgi:hypothetical protein